MDAAGNLTDLSEFSGGRRIRLISYLSEDVAIGTFPPDNRLGVRLISNGSPPLSIFHAVLWSNPDGEAPDGAFCLTREGSDTAFNSWARLRGDRDRIVCTDFTQNFVISTRPELLTVEFVDSCWFRLKETKQGHVVDCAASDVFQGNPILWWDENGGDNQKWRAATTGPGLTT